MHDQCFEKESGSRVVTNPFQSGSRPLESMAATGALRRRGVSPELLRSTRSRQTTESFVCLFLLGFGGATRQKCSIETESRVISGAHSYELHTQTDTHTCTRYQVVCIVQNFETKLYGILLVPYHFPVIIFTARFHAKILPSIMKCANPPSATFWLL